MDELKEIISTTLSEGDQVVGTGAGAPPPDVPEEPAKDQSIRDVLASEAKAQAEAEKEARREAKAEKAEKVEDVKEDKATKAEEPPKEEKAPAEKAEVAEAEKSGDAAAQETKPAQSSEGRADKIPARLLPKEREVWGNVPNVVKSAWERMEREHAEATKKYEPAVKFHEELREFDEMARKSGTDLKSALANFVNAENAIRQDFGRGIAQLAQSMGKNPVEAVAQLMRASGVLPQQLGAYLQGQPVQQAQPQQQRQADPVAQRALQEVAQLKQQLQQQEAIRAQEQLTASVIEPFRQQNPRFDELEDDIAFFLKSGRIPSSLSHAERLEAAYDMAVRINPSPVAAAAPFAESAVLSPANPDAGKKSVRGAPANGQGQSTEDDETDLLKILRKEAQRLAS